MKTTKIIATLGPSSANEQEMIQMIQDGVNIFRVNFSHGTKEDHASLLHLIHHVNTLVDTPASILIDTRGPEIRIGTFENGSVMLKKDQTFTFYKEQKIGNQNGVSLSQSTILNHITVGKKFLANDGMMRFEVQSVDHEKMVTKVLTDGKLSNRKNLTFLKVPMGLPYISQEDKEDILQAISIGCDMIACSFMSNLQDIIAIKQLLNTIPNHLKIIAKIEGEEAITNLDDIITHTDGVMVARGDLGVEMPYQQLPILQDKIVAAAKKHQKPCIIATEMLESMIVALRPTRAEITDIYQAVKQQAYAVMLSAESAMGKHPSYTIQVLSSILEEAEKYYSH